MAWIDDRIWCHPKLNDLSDRAYRVWVSSIAWSCGMQTKGVLKPGDQKMLGSTAKVRGELVNAGLWDDLNGNGSVQIHDCEQHNGRRDRQREQNAERKRRQRLANNGVTEA